ncbi:MAG: hypothetical protein Q9163_003464 [Psora crenata]
MELPHCLTSQQDINSPPDLFEPPSSPSSSSPSPPPFLQSSFNHQTEGTASLPWQLPSTVDLSYFGPGNDAYSIDSRQSTPYDNTFRAFTDSQPQYMTGAFSPNPRLRIEQSTPSNEIPSAITPPPMSEGSTWAQASWNNLSPTRAYLSPQAQQYTRQNPFHTHKRLSSGSSVGSVGPDSPYTQTQAYPHIVDLDTGSAASPQLDPYDTTSYHPAQHYGKPLYAPSSAFNALSLFNPTFDDFNISDNDAVSMMAGHHTMRQAVAQQDTSGVNAEQRNPRRSFGGMDGSTVVQTNIPKLDRTVSDVYQDELFDSSLGASAPCQRNHQHQHQYCVTQAQLLSPSYRSVFNDRLKEAHTARSVSPSTNMSRERSPFRDSSEFAGQTFQQDSGASAATQINSTVQIGGQQNMPTDTDMYASRRHDYESTPKTISPKEAQRDYDESQDDFKMRSFHREPDFSSAHAAHTQFASGDRNTTHDNRHSQDDHTKDNDSKKKNNIKLTKILTGVANNHAVQDYASLSDRRRSPKVSTSQQPSSNYTFMPASGPTSVQPQKYPFITRRRRQSSSMRSGQSDQVPEFPASLSSMESTKSDSAQEQNIRPPAFASQDTRSSQRSDDAASPIPRPSDTSAKSGTYTCVATGCSARFDTSAKLQKHRRANHRDSPRHGSTPTTKSPSTSRSHNSQTAVNNVSRNNAHGPHRCEQIISSTGKPCNAVFSRSYDLTRHEASIHDNEKTKVRCGLCTEEKTFSRSDALTRHMRVVHPNVDYPGRNRRRGGV